jgi:hypothetical protein
MRLPYAILGYARDKEDIQLAVDCCTALGELQIRKGYAPLWWKDTARYERERHETLPGVERIQTAEELHAMQAGDCDDHAPSLAASLNIAGIPARAVVIESPGIGYHVVVRAKRPDGRVIVLDPSARRGMLRPQEMGAVRLRKRLKLRGALDRLQQVLTQASRLNPASAAARALTQEASRLMRVAKSEAATIPDDEQDEGE